MSFFSFTFSTNALKKKKKNEEAMWRFFVFDQLIDQGVLPDLETLIFVYNFNRSIKVVLPHNLKDLEFGTEFNQPIEKGVLPSFLKNLTLGRDFDQSIEKGVLPETLKTLTLGQNFKQPIEKDALPESLENIWILDTNDTKHSYHSGRRES